MRPMKRIATALVLAVVALAGAAAPAAAQDNAAVAINTKDDSSLFKLAFSIKQVSSDVVDNVNAAVAFGSCERCRTVAIAIQVVLVTAEHPHTVTPENLALALNVECPECVTVALAYQYVIGGGDPMRLTAEGRQMIADIRRRLWALRDSLEDPNFDPAALERAVGDLYDELRRVIDTQLVPRGSPDAGGGGADSDEDLPQPEEDATERLDQGEPPPQEEPPPETQPQEPAPAPQPEPEPTPAPAPEEGSGTTTSP
jgi:putative peptide zinc metalloprotease protein